MEGDRQVLRVAVQDVVLGGQHFTTDDVHERHPTICHLDLVINKRFELSQKEDLLKVLHIFLHIHTQTGTAQDQITHAKYHENM